MIDLQWYGYLQSILLKLGFYNSKIDNKFGQKTKQAVEAFQRFHEIPTYGVVEENTWNLLKPYIKGKQIYRIKENDTIYSIANRFNTTVNRIKLTNPDLDKNGLIIGDKIIVPTGNIIPTNISYSSNILELNINALKELYPFMKVATIGNSILGKDIKCIKIGDGAKEVFYHASIHANEWITSVVFMKFIEQYCKSIVDNTNIYENNARSIYQDCTLYIVPMANPDGVDLVTGQIKQGENSYIRAKEIADNFPSIPFPDGWKANINGTDLNLQFPAGWENAKEIKYAQGFNRPAPRDYVGNAPISEPEAIALYDFTNKFNFSLILSYHSQGEVIYWRFQDYLPERSEEIGIALSESSGYQLEDTPYNSSFAGYKDWFIQDFNKPGYTVEVGLGENPLPISQFPKIYEDNLGILVLSMILS